jgi:hypothetical protein
MAQPATVSVHWREGKYAVPARTTEEPMTTLTRFAAALSLAAASIIVGSAPAANAQTGEDFFVLDTQFSPGPTTVVDAGGAFEGCWKASDLWGSGIQLPDGTVWFEGEKRLQCASGAKVTVHYIVQQVPTGTVGTWDVTGSTLAGATSGGGTLVGDSTACTPERNAGGCILDTFAGDVS